MKIPFLICSLFTISFYSMKAQDKIAVDINLKTEPTDKINFTETNIQFKINKEIDTERKVTNTLEYSHLNINYELGSFESFENSDHFNQLQNQFEFSQNVSKTTGLKFALTPTANFQQNFGISDITILGSIEVYQKLTSKTELNVGVARTTVFGYPKIIPVLSLNFRINDKSTMLIGFPDSKLEYSNNVRNKLSLTNSFNGNFYNLDSQMALNKEATKVNLSQMTSAFEYERNVDHNWFLNFKGGYNFNKKYTLIDNENHEVYDYNTGNGYILSIGIKYKQ
ncbi:hypothetical protein SAMN05444397_10438 [Flavobacterium aquidurense]|uniref:DUF6268 domain-containing protein n=1 Tax=Flavobacterium frigidimaris TaxID=262320 RepID=A0ABX4BR74_FLAFR|nr:DUF6268 family outer membrane beta-barrel protein [Flavobacterium frigidimaris]OXA79673.1 hypothetical protein B0A65_09935 [Flavobacterium frigidimaris]SDZ17727.1 hypothetical protein SAMN05444397_10438 [Flavobacterium aquidurense]